jgi:hypothetical protein
MRLLQVKIEPGKAIRRRLASKDQEKLSLSSFYPPHLPSVRGHWHEYLPQVALACDSWLGSSDQSTERKDWVCIT